LKTLFHSFIVSRLDYCNAALAGSSQYITDILQCVLDVSALLVTSTNKYDNGLSQLLHDELQWLDVPQRVQYKLTVMVLQCVQNRTPKYLVDCCIPVSDIATRQHLSSASRHHLTFPCYRWSTFGRRAFSVDDLERTARRSLQRVMQCQWLLANVKDSIVHQILVYLSRLRCCMKSRYINLLLTLIVHVRQPSHHCCNNFCCLLFYA